MFLCTMAGAVEAADLSIFATILMNGTNSQMVEYLMAGFWILLRNPANRKVLGQAFTTDPAHAAAKSIAAQLNDAILLEEVNEAAQEQVGRIVCLVLLSVMICIDIY